MARLIDRPGNKGRREAAAGIQISGGSRRNLPLGVLGTVKAETRGSDMAARTYGTISPERRKAMSGLEFVKGLVDRELPLNTFAQTLGYDVVEVESGRVAIVIDPTGAHLNPSGQCTAA